MSQTVTITGLRWAVGLGNDERGTHHEGRAWMADRPEVLVVLVRVYYDGDRSTRDQVRRRALALFGHNPTAELANELGETIPPGG